MLKEEPGERDAEVIDAAARVARWTRDQPQALVLSGSEAALRNMLGTTRAFDVVAVCAASEVIRRLGLEPVDDVSPAEGG